jgi:tetratricopeptide (TPR) repeat protein
MRFLFMEQHDYQAAENQTRKEVEFNRRRADSLLARKAEPLSAGEKNTFRMLAVSLEQLAIMLREQGKPECVEPSKEAIGIYQFIGDKSTEAISAFNLGHAYVRLPALRNLDEAERWYRRSLELRAEGDRKGKGGCMAQLGLVAYERFNDAKKEGKAEEELLKHLNAAVDYYQQALALLPPDAVDDIAVAHNQLGVIYKNAGDLERALEHYNKSIQYKEMAGNIYAAGGTRFNIASLLAENGRLSDALLYARAALHNFESYGGRAKDWEDKAKGLIAEIEKAIHE